MSVAVKEEEKKEKGGLNLPNPGVELGIDQASGERGTSRAMLCWCQDSDPKQVEVSLLLTEFLTPSSDSRDNDGDGIVVAGVDQELAAHVCAVLCACSRAERVQGRAVPRAAGARVRARACACVRSRRRCAR